MVKVIRNWKHDRRRRNAGKSRAAHRVWSSLEKRRAEHEEIVKVKIPANTKEIDCPVLRRLSENFDSKRAKQWQSV